MSSNKKRALGKGLDALLGSAQHDYNRPRAHKIAADDVEKIIGGIAEIPVDQIEANPFQPRTHFEKEALLELAHSIKTLGVIQPITVRKLDEGKYQLISGERRLRASQAAQMESIPAYVRIANDQGMLEMALVENIQRSDLNAIEVALSYQRLMEECGLTQEEMGKRVGKNRASISNFIRLLNLPPEVQTAIQNKLISFGHARALSALNDEDIQIYILDKILEEGLSVRATEEMVKESKENQKAVSKSKKKKAEVLSFQHQKFKEDLSAKLNAKVQININNKGKGKLVIPIDSEEHFNKLMKLLDA